MKRMVCLSLAIFLNGAGSALAAPVTACAATGTSEWASSSGAKVVIDPATRLPIRMERPAKGVLIITVADKSTSIRREFREGRSMTTIRAGRGRLVIAMSGEEITITDNAGTRRGVVSKPEGLAAVFADFGTSPVVRAGRDLLNRLALQADTLEGNALLLTRALLASAIGDRTSTIQHQQWARWKMSQPKVVRARASSDLGPGDCWDKYAAEAIRIMNDYIDCYSNCKWYQLFCGEGCGAIYDLRAEMAFMWYFNCNGPFYGG